MSVGSLGWWLVKNGACSLLPAERVHAWVCVCQCVTVPCMLMSASPLAAAGAVSFSLRSVQQQQAVWLSGSMSQWQINLISTLSVSTDVLDIR